MYQANQIEDRSDPISQWYVEHQRADTDYSSSKEFVIFRLSLITGNDMKYSRFFLFSMNL